MRILTYKLKYHIIFLLTVVCCMMNISYAHAENSASPMDTHLADSGGYVISTSDFEKENTAGDIISLYPLITSDGNTNNYLIEWFRSDDDGGTWNKVSESTSTKAEGLVYTYYADCSQTFSRFKYRLTNEAGTIESGILTTYIYEKFSIKDGNLTVESTGYVENENLIQEKMNDYTDPRWNGRTTPWKNKEFTEVTINNHILSVGEEAFKDHGSLTHVFLSSGDLKEINDSAFEGTGLLGITIPESVERIKKNSFKGCNNLRDIRFLGKTTLISEEVGTIPGTSDDLGVEDYNRTNDTYRRKHGYPIVYGYAGGEAEKYVNKFNSGSQISYNFVPIDDTNGKLIEWNYTVNKESDTIDNLYTETPVIGEITVPKSIDGYLITEIGNIEDENGNERDLFGKKRDEAGELVSTTDGITSVRLLDNIENIGKDAITNCPNLKTVYNEYFGEQTFLDRDGKSIGKASLLELGEAVEDAEVYLYSSNAAFEKNHPNKYTRFFYDKALSGITQNTSWTLDMKTNILTVSKYSGNSYKDYSFDWAYEYIEEIYISQNIEKIADNLFSGLVNVHSVYNYSNVITSVGKDAFLNVGTDIDGVKTCLTFVNNMLYDSILTADTENPFKFQFVTTTRSCGPNTVGTNPVEFTYEAASGSLTLHARGTSEVESVMDTYTEDNIPWRCIKPYIKEIYIEKYVASISKNAFTKLPNLKEVYNKGKNQVIIGGGELFDVINRYSIKNESPDGISIIVPDNIDYDMLWKELYDLGFKSVTIDMLEAASINPGRHVIYGYMTAEEVITSLEENTKLIVPVYGYYEENKTFFDEVPQPETKGYRIESIYLDSGICGDNLKWYLYRDGILEIEGSGVMYDYSEENPAPWQKHKDKIFDIAISKSATRIGSYAFDGLTEITYVEIPSGIKSIGLEAFQNSGITKFVMTYNVETIDGALFTGCENLKSFSGSDVNFVIDNGILYNRDKTILVEYLREKIYKPGTFEPYELIDEITIPDHVVEIAERAFYGNSTLIRMYIPSAVKKIGSQSLAEMNRLYFIDCKTGEFDEPYTGDTSRASVQETNENALQNSANKYPSREVLIYKANTDFTKAAAAAGYNIRYYDSMNIHHINANYTGSEIVIGQTVPMKDVQFDIVYASGLNETATGEDVRFSVKGSMTITNVGDNVFKAIYNDGYTDPIETGEFTVPGINRITEMSVKYNGLDVWYGESLAPSNVMVSLKYANGDIKTISGSSEFITYSDKLIDTLDKNSHSGEEEIIVTYNDKQNKVFSGTIKVGCSDYVESISAKYLGTDTIESTAGINGLSDKMKEDIQIDVKWKSSNTSETINGMNGSVSYSGGGSVVDSKLQITVGYNNNNRYDKTAVVNIPCASNVRDVGFTYVGGLVTKGTSLNLSNILITVYYTDGTQQSFKGDTVENLTATPMIINNYGANTVTVKYAPPGFEKTEDIIVMGTIAIPVKLIITERPKKTVYQAGELFERDGLRVNCLYDNGEIQDVSDLVVIENGTTLTAETKNITISYTENRDGQDHVVKTYMAININQNQKALLRKKTFQESYEINRILFRSKKTEDVSGIEDDGVLADEEEDDEEENGKWTEITLNDNSKGESTDLSASIKAGYGFELKVYTKYKTNRGSNEFKDFMTKTQWDNAYENPENPLVNPDTWKTAYANQSDFDSIADYIANKADWDYLNDVYPQYVPTSNPDLMYVRIIKRDADSGDRYTQIDGKDFIIMEKTNKDEKNFTIDEGEWYNSQKIFEFPLRVVNEDGEIINTDDENGGDRRVYVSRDAAESDSANTEYVIQILSPAWYGYESEPEFDDVSNRFIINDEEAREGVLKNWHNGDAFKYLHVAYEFSLFVQKNDDIHTHILQ